MKKRISPLMARYAYEAFLAGFMDIIYEWKIS